MVAVAGGAAPESASRASPMSRKRRVTSRSRHRPSSARTCGGTSAGSAVQSGSDRSTDASVSETVSPSNVRRPVSISNSTQPNAQMSVRLSTRLAARLLGAHVGRRAENHAGLGRAGRSASASWRADARVDRPGAPSAFARPKSSTLTRAVRRDLDVRRLEIAMDDAVLVRRFESLGDLPRDRQRLVRVRAARADAACRRACGRRRAP